MNGNTAGDPDGQYTFVSEQGNSAIDYALVSLDFMSKASLFLEIGCKSESRHIPLHLSISYNPDHCTTKCKTSKKEHRIVFRWDPDKTDLFSEAVSSKIFREKLTEAYNLLNESVEFATKLFTDNLLQAADVMKRTFWFDNSKGHVTNQWFDRECKVKRRETRQALLRFKKTNDDKDKHIYVQKRSQYKSTIAEKKNKYERSVHHELFSNKQNSRKIWDSVRKARQKKKTLPDIEITKWETHFRNVLNHSSSITDQIDDHDRTRPQANRASMSDYHMNEMCIDELDRPISKEEVRQSIRNLKQGKAPELDNICGEYLKYAEANITPFFYPSI